MANDWMDLVDPRELAALVPADALSKVDDPDAAIRAIGQQLESRGLVQESATRGLRAPPVTVKQVIQRAAQIAPASTTRGTRGIAFWDAVKKEFYLLCCTADPKYEEARAGLKKHGSGATTIIVSTISAAIGSILGLAAGICVPIISMLLLVVLNVGKNAYCATAAGK